MLQKCRSFAAAVLILAAVLSAAAYCITPGCPLPVFGQGELQIFWNGGGGLSLTWPEADSCTEYQVSVRSGSRHFEERCTEPYASFSGLTDGERLRVTVRAVSEGVNLFGMERQVRSWKTLKASVPPVEVNALALEAEVEPGNVWLSWNGRQGKRYAICAVEDGISYPVASTRGTALSLRFGGELEYPSSKEPFQVVVREGFTGKGYTLYGPPSNRLSLERSDLLNDHLSLTWEETAPWNYTLLWSEARGDRYELRQWQSGVWKTVFEMDSGPQSISYEIGRVGSGSLQRYRLAAIDREGNELSAEEISFYADVSPVYATVWPVMDLTCYDAPNGVRSQGSIPAGTTLCVLEETGEWFQVRYQDQYVYIDKRFCLINLPEYLGDYCAYDITNSYASAFRIHDRPLTQITGQVLPGFESVQTNTGFLVPCLYPSAVKLLEAAKAAAADGYRLKVYEAFRPQQASEFLYETVSEQLEFPALLEDSDGNAVNPVTGESIDLSTGLPAEPEDEDAGQTDNEPEEETNAPGTQRIPVDPNPPERLEAPEPEEETPAEPAEDASAEPDTNLKIMAGNRRLTLDDFLDSGVSDHNQGIALDLTLEDLDSGAELAMQSAVHDLSWHSEARQNNDLAKRLANYMTAAGLTGNSSEWWHFQDTAVQDAFRSNAVLPREVSAFGLVRDDIGWRCRMNNGDFAKNTLVTVDEIPYTIDEDGYLID